MTENTHEHETVRQRAIADWLPVVLRGLVALVLTPAAVLKFADHSAEAAAFAEYGIPAPDITVLVIGAIQLPAALMIAFGVAGRLGALVMVPIMLTAMVTAGVVPANVIVFGGCVGSCSSGRAATRSGSRNYGDMSGAQVIPRSWLTLI